MNSYGNFFSKFHFACGVVLLLVTGCIKREQINQYDVGKVFDSSYLSLNQPVFSQNGELVAFSGFDADHYESQIFILDTDTSEVDEIYKGAVVSVQSWSSSESDLIVSDYRNIMILSDYKTSKELIPLTSGTVASLSNSESMLAILERKNAHLIIKVWDLVKKREEILLDRENIINAYSISWSPNDKKLLISATGVSVTPNVEIYLYDLENKIFIQLTSGVDGEENLFPTWLDLNHILYLQTNIHNYDANFIVMELDTTCQLKIPLQYASSFSLSPDKQEIVYTLKNNAVYLSDTNLIFGLLDFSKTCDT